MERDFSSLSDSDFDPGEALRKNPAAMIEKFSADRVTSLPREDLYLLLFQILLQQEFLLLAGPAAKMLSTSTGTTRQFKSGG